MAGILFDIVHPADVLFFKKAILTFQQNGVPVKIVSRNKDVTCTLLDDLGLVHDCVTKAGSGLVDLGMELIIRDLKLWNIARKFRPDVMVGFGGVGISHVGVVCRCPSLSFYDTDHAHLQQRLTLPFITEWHVPTCYKGLEAKGKTFRFDGYKELSYLHPENFTPSREIAIENGLDPTRQNFVLRFVGWEANHDIGYSGLTEDHIENLVTELAPKGKVLISSEGKVPDSLKSYLYQGNIKDFHHVLACADLVLGESVTVATEAAMLGTPSLTVIPLALSYVEALAAEGIMTWHKSYDRQQVHAWINKTLQETSWREKVWQPFIQRQVNVSDYVISQIQKYLPAEILSEA